MLSVPISEIYVDERLREPFDSIVNRLEIDIKENGQLRPLVVIDYNHNDYKYQLVDGLHRIKAMRRLGWKYALILIKEPKK